MGPIKGDVAFLKILVYVAVGTGSALLLLSVPFAIFVRRKYVEVVGRRALNHQLEYLVHEDTNAEADNSEFDRVISNRRRNEE